MRNVVCGYCGKEFECKTNAKYCCKECSKEAHRLKQIALQKKRYVREHICKLCGKIFPTHQGRNDYCDECNKLRKTCSICGGNKNSDHLHCNKCKKESHTYVCQKCGKQCTGMPATLYCDECYPRCKVCGKKVNQVHNGCCSISCATKYKRDKTSTNKLLNHLNDLLDGKYNNGNRSIDNDKRENFFSDNGIGYEKEFKIYNNDIGLENKYVFYDFKIGNYLIEINPTFSHNSTLPYRNGSKPKPNNYHMYKSLLGESEGYNVINLFDWDDNDKVKHWLIGLLKGNKRLYGSEIKDVDSKVAFDFCEQNHLQGGIHCSVWHGLYSNHGDLISLMGRTRYPKKGYWELTRFVNKEGFYIAHGAEKLFKYFIKCFNPNLIVSYSDRTKHTGKLYDNLGFKCEYIDKPGYRWVNKKTNKPYRRTSCRKDMMHLLPGFSGVEKYNKDNITPFWQHSEDELMISHGYVKVFNCGNRRHIRKP